MRGAFIAGKRRSLLGAHNASKNRARTSTPVANGDRTRENPATGRYTASV